MAAAKIPEFPYEQDAYRYEGEALRKSWDRLHRGDHEAFPADPKLQAAWRAFHRGDFAEAIAQGAKLKAAGANAASKAAAVAATYLVDDDKAAVQLLLEAGKRADAYKVLKLALTAVTGAGGLLAAALALQQSGLL